MEPLSNQQSTTSGMRLTNGLSEVTKAAAFSGCAFTASSYERFSISVRRAFSVPPWETRSTFLPGYFLSRRRQTVSARARKSDKRSPLAAVLWWKFKLIFLSLWQGYSCSTSCTSCPSQSPWPRSRSSSHCSQTEILSSFASACAVSAALFRSEETTTSNFCFLSFFASSAACCLPLSLRGRSLMPWYLFTVFQSVSPWRTSVSCTLFSHAEPCHRISSTLSLCRSICSQRSWSQKNV